MEEPSLQHSKGLENEVIILAALTDIETDWHRAVADVGMSCARTRLHVIIHGRVPSLPWTYPGECERHSFVLLG